MIDVKNNALLIQIGVRLYVIMLIEGILGHVSDFAGAGDVITNLTKKREPGDIEHTP